MGVLDVGAHAEPPHESDFGAAVDEISTATRVDVLRCIGYRGGLAVAVVTDADSSVRDQPAGKPQAVTARELDGCNGGRQRDADSEGLAVEEEGAFAGLLEARD